MGGGGGSHLCHTAIALLSEWDVRDAFSATLLQLYLLQYLDEMWGDAFSATLLYSFIRKEENPPISNEL